MEKVLEGIYENIIEKKHSIINVSKDINEQKVNTINDQVILFLSISNHKSQTYVIRGDGKDFSNALDSAMETYTNHKPKKFTPRSVKLDLVTDIFPIKDSGTKFNLSKDNLAYNKGLDGLAFGTSLETAFLPGEVASYNLVNKKKLNIDKIFNALDKHLPSTFAKFTRPFDESNQTDVYKFRTKEYYIDKNGFHKLYRGHRIFSELSKQDLWEAIQLTKDNYFKNVVQKSGKFIYSFLPHENKQEKRYNVLRHAGTSYSMLETYELMPDEKLLIEAERALSYLIQKNIKTFSINDEKVKVVVEKDKQKIGGNALAIVAMAKHAQVTKSHENIKLMQDLALWFKKSQGEDGAFKVHIQEHSTGKHLDFVSRFYPGQAILALVRLYHLDNNEEWLDIAEKAADHLINIRDRSETIDTISHDHWLLYALNDLYRERSNEIYLSHSFFIAEAMMQTQYSKKDTSNEELIGGYLTEFGNKPKNSTPAACKDEGLSVVYNLAKDFGYNEIADRVKNSINEGIKFQLQMQLRPESVLYYKRKKLCLGAVQGGLRDLSLRNDFTQHNISSFIAYYNILNKSK